MFQLKCVSRHQVEVADKPTVYMFGFLLEAGAADAAVLNVKTTDAAAYALYRVGLVYSLESPLIPMPAEPA